MPPGALERLLGERSRVDLTPHQTAKVQLIIEADTGPAGWISVDIKSREHGIGEIGYLIGECYRGRGLAAHAVRALCPLAFDMRRLALERLEAVAAVENAPSRRTLETAGFRFEGIRRGYLKIQGERIDHAAYALLRSDWLEDKT